MKQILFAIAVFSFFFFGFYGQVGAQQAQPVQQVHSERLKVALVFVADRFRDRRTEDSLRDWVEGVYFLRDQSGKVYQLEVVGLNEEPALKLQLELHLDGGTVASFPNLNAEVRNRQIDQKIQQLRAQQQALRSAVAQGTGRLARIPVAGPVLAGTAAAYGQSLPDKIDLQIRQLELQKASAANVVQEKYRIRAEARVVHFSGQDLTVNKVHVKKDFVVNYDRLSFIEGSKPVGYLDPASDRLKVFDKTTIEDLGQRGRDILLLEMAAAALLAIQ
jgi:hypothetical protein